MLAAYMIGLLPDGEAVYTDSLRPIEEQKKTAMGWLATYDQLLSVHAVVGGTISDITASYCRMWINNADLSSIEEESDFPSLIRETVPELVSDLINSWDEEARGQRDHRSHYLTSVL